METTTSCNLSLVFSHLAWSFRASEHNLPQLHSVPSGGELFLSYGAGFWEFQRERARAVREDQERELEIEQVLVLLLQCIHLHSQQQQSQHYQSHCSAHAVHRVQFSSAVDTLG